MLGQLGHVVLELIHRYCTGNVVWQMGKQISENFGAQDLMDPYLEPGLSLELNIAEGISDFARAKGKLGIFQCRPAPAK